MNDLLTHDQKGEMFSFQNAINCEVNPDWINAKYPFLRAAALEAGEAIEHHGWKWWKKQEKDLPQLQMELVDIWHFILSAILVANDGDIEASISRLDYNPDEQIIEFDDGFCIVREMDTVAKLELLMGLSVSRRISILLFSAILEDCGVSWNGLYKQYIAKNVLNMFRQNYGYKDGTYHKIWAGREDNVHLVEIVNGIVDCAHHFADEVYIQLRDRYTSLVIAHSSYQW